MKLIFRSIFALFTLLCYGSVLISPDRWWPAGFLSMSIPFVIASHFFLLLIYIRKFNVVFFFHLIALAVGFVFIKITFSLTTKSNTAEGIKVLSYNVRVFNNYNHLKNKEFASSKKMISWAVDVDADIKCFQEFYNHNRSEIFNVTEKIKKAGWKYQHSKVILSDRAKAEFGTVIFSKYPMIRTGDVEDAQGNFGNVIFADILIGSDTVRVYNVHLQSMSIDENNVLDTDRLRKSYKETGYRLRRGFVRRSKEIDGLLNHIDKCPYKMILCGDFNDMPYSYPYFSVRRKLQNAFEKAGNGFGFSYNGKLFFLRIDNQFFSEGIDILEFKTHRNINFSDHFPLTATYGF